MSEKSNAMTVDELSELDELLASVDESAEPMDASEADRLFPIPEAGLGGFFPRTAKPRLLQAVPQKTSV